MHSSFAHNDSEQKPPRHRGYAESLSRPCRCYVDLLVDMQPPELQARRAFDPAILNRLGLIKYLRTNRHSALRLDHLGVPQQKAVLHNNKRTPDKQEKRWAAGAKPGQSPTAVTAPGTPTARGGSGGARGRIEYWQKRAPSRPPGPHSAGSRRPDEYTYD